MRKVKLDGTLVVDARLDAVPAEGEVWVEHDNAMVGDRVIDGVWCKPDGTPYPPAPQRAKTKLEIKEAVGDAKWAAVKAFIAAIAQDPATESLAEDWNLAVEIDPADPKTQMAMAGMVQAGIFTEEEIANVFR